MMADYSGKYKSLFKYPMVTLAVEILPEILKR
jgi:hypothetical protein